MSRSPIEVSGPEDRVPDAQMENGCAVTAASLGLVACHACMNLCPEESIDQPCPRCGARVHRRKPDSLSRTWALLLAAYILYIPANTMPIMVTRSILGTQADTIFSGVVYLWKAGSYALSLIVLVASIVVPLLKMFILTFLLLTIHFRSRWRVQERTRLYRLVESIGRWSMLDVFVVALLVSLVQSGALASVIPGDGVMAFSAVVVLTMLASLSFDPRLLWDTLDNRHA